jgi:uncharacterized protein YheU (UPF0270 family)
MLFPKLNTRKASQSSFSSINFRMQIPYRSISEDTLANLIVDFVTRDGTDVGHDEISIAQKITKIKGLLDSGEVIITFDEESESCSIEVS